MKIYDKESISKKIKRKNMIVNIIKIITYPVIILIFLACILLSIQKIENPEGLPSLFGYRAFIIVSGSMEPTLNIGDIVVIRETEKENIKPNDIITFLEDNGQNTITHRVTDIVENNGKVKYQTKGDNNNSADDTLITYEEIAGIYQFKIPKVGKLIMKLHNPTAMIISILALFIVFKFIERKDERKFMRHEIREKYTNDNNKDDK